MMMGECKFDFLRGGSDCSGSDRLGLGLMMIGSSLGCRMFLICRLGGLGLSLGLFVNRRCSLTFWSIHLTASPSSCCNVTAP